jgi:hypothetical protein
MKRIKSTKESFYLKYPDFDWRFYISIYSDLCDKEMTEQDAIRHYEKCGVKEQRRTRPIITHNMYSNCYCSTEPYLMQIYNNTSGLGSIPVESILPTRAEYVISPALQYFRRQFTRKFPNLSQSGSANLVSDYPRVACVFFGMYADEDIEALYLHSCKNIAYIIWGGEDANPSNTHSMATISEVSNIQNVIHLSISRCIYDSLKSCGIDSIMIDFNLVDNDIFYPIEFNSNGGRSIYVYNGSSPGRENIYGSEIYVQIIDQIIDSGVKIIYSNTLDISYEEMRNIYRQCFIALRLTSHDGNANTVQECNSVGLPIVHNMSSSGLKWKTKKDVLLHISNVYYAQFKEHIELSD